MYKKLLVFSYYFTEHMKITEAIKELEQWNIVVIPTETVYGLAADATNISAIKNIFITKNRPQDNPLIVHVWHKKDINTYAKIQSDLEKTLIEKFMPWPFTILLHKKNTISDTVTAGSTLVAIRIPQHPIALKILQDSWLALAAPSANISGKPSPTNITMVEQNFGDSVAVVDGGRCAVWIESTVVQVQWDSVIIHRPGFITPTDIHLAIGKDVPVIYSNEKNNISPGIKYKHYAPKAQIHLLEPGSLLPINSAKRGLIVTDERISKHQCEIAQSNCRIYRRGSHANLLECAQKLYDLYYQADKDGILHIYIESLPEENGVAYAIMNRVKKSLE